MLFRIEAIFREFLPSFIAASNVRDDSLDELKAELFVSGWNALEGKVVLYCRFPLVSDSPVDVIILSLSVV